MSEGDWTALDAEFGHYLRRRWSASDAVARLGSHLSAALRAGHSGLPRPEELDLDEPCLGRPGARTPLMLDGDLVFLGRVWALEDRVARALRARTVPRSRVPSSATVALADQLFDAPGPQRDGAFLPFQGALSIITGGPGTGKTWVLGRLLALQMTERGVLPRVALAAPTGKAAQRMAEALRSSAKGLPEALAKALLNLVPQTLHRLLLEASPLPYDLVVVDEASMVDLHLADRLLTALAPETDLVLLGDPDQLPSVDAGRVLSDAVEVLAQTEPSPVVRLTKSRRFVEGQAVGVLAGAILSQTLAQAESVLSDRSDPAGPSSFRLVQGLTREALLTQLSRNFGAFWASGDPQTALHQLTEFLVLAAINEGPWGQQGLNQALVERAPKGAPRPIMITENDPRSGLSNGDLGVIWSTDGHEVAWFGDGRERHPFPVALLGPHQTAYAITIHKSQGSEFERLAIVLPPGQNESRLELSRELVYTAVTRAKSHGVIYGTLEQLQEATRTATVRHSGLSERLRAWQNPST